MRSRGFTLVELLAVIAILAIIALIVIPIISKMIDDAKENAAKRNAELYMDAVMISISNKNIESGFPSGRVVCSVLEKDTLVGKTKYNQGDLKCDDLYVRVSAEKNLPLKGKLIIENEEIDKSSVWLEMKHSYIFGYKNDVLVRLDKSELDQINEYLIASLPPGLYNRDLGVVKTWEELLQDGLDLNSGDSNAELLNDLESGKLLIIGSKDVNDNDITSIGEIAFLSCINLTNVIIRDNITSIGTGAFTNCTNLVSVSIPSSMVSIGEESFYDCINLSSIMIPSSVVNIGSGAFFGCASLSSIIVDSNNSVYDSRDNSNALIETESNTLLVGCKNTIIPSNIEVIGTGAFFGIEDLTSITIPSSVTIIAAGAFECTGLTNITIPSSVVFIDDFAFESCINLLSINILSGEIGFECFANCISLSNVVFGSNVTSIGFNAFSGCESLTSIYIPSSVTSIGLGVFSGCNRLESIVVDSNNTAYDSRNSSNAIIETETNILLVGCKNTIIPSNIEVIGDSAFSGIEDLTSITIPSSVTSIGFNAFSGCTGLTNITIPSSVLDISPYAFYGCTGLTSITIPFSVASIGSGAFLECTGIESVTIENGVISIGSNAFNTCTSLASITIPSSVTTIGYYAFANTSLTSVYIPSSVINVDEKIFNNCNSNLQIRCGALSKPSGWNTRWNYYDSSHALNVTWGVSS